MVLLQQQLLMEVGVFKPLADFFKTSVSDTPGTQLSETPGATPFRDQLNINRGEQKASVDELKRQLKNLPAPKNDFEVVLPDEVDEPEESMDIDWISDAGEADERKKTLLEKKKQKELAARSQVFRKKLPIPSKLNDGFFKRIPVKNPYDEVSWFFICDELLSHTFIVASYSLFSIVFSRLD